LHDHTIPMFSSTHHKGGGREWKAPPRSADHRPPPVNGNGRWPLSNNTIALITGILLFLVAVAAIWNQRDDHYDLKFEAVDTHLDVIDSKIAANTQANIDQLSYLDRINEKINIILQSQQEVRETLKIHQQQKRKPSE